MKNIIFFILSFTSLSVYAQSEGIFYQAVIENLDDINLPGTNSNGNFLPNADIVVNFKISDEIGNLIYQEYHLTTTDSEGMIHLRIGSGLAPSSNFDEIEWHGDPKNLEVSINYDNSAFMERDFKELLFIPYAYHRDMIVTQNLTVAGNSLFNGNLTVNGITDMNNQVRVTNNSRTELSGDLTVDGESTLNDNLSVLNQSETLLSGNLEVQSHTHLKDSLNVINYAKLGDSLKVLNNSTTYLSGSLDVDQHTQYKTNLRTEGSTFLKDSITVTNNSPTLLTGTLGVLQEVILDSSLILAGTLRIGDSLMVNNNSVTHLTGLLETSQSVQLDSTLNVSNIASLYDTLNVNNGNSGFTGDLDVFGNTELNNRLDVMQSSTFRDSLNVNNHGNTKFSGTLNTSLDSNFNGAFIVNQNINNETDLLVSGITRVDTLKLSRFIVQSDSDINVSSITNTNQNNGDGLVIKLGRTHGAWNNGSYYQTATFSNSQIAPSMNTIRGWINGQNVTASDLISLIPSSFLPGGFSQINRQVVQHIKDSMGLPITFPTLGDALSAANQVGLPIEHQFTNPRLFQGYTLFDGGEWCTPQRCWRVGPRLFRFTVCAPPWQVCTPQLPRIRVPSIDLNSISLMPPRFNLLPDIPPLPVYGGLPDLQVPLIDAPVVPNSLTNDNEYIRFEDKEGRLAGKIRAESVLDYANRTKLDDGFVFELLASLITFDGIEFSISGNTAFNRYSTDFNQLGVQYSSGHGDYAEWLEREDTYEKIMSGDIVAVNAGKITKDKSAFEQIMIVSHKPIIHGNTPAKGEEHSGNKVAFLGQVPVKILGPVKTGDYIVIDDVKSGYGIAKSSDQLTIEDFQKIAGQAWETNLNDGPKIINCLVGKTSNTWQKVFEKHEKTQKELENSINDIQLKLEQVAKKRLTSLKP